MTQKRWAAKPPTNFSALLGLCSGIGRRPLICEAIIRHCFFRLVPCLLWDPTIIMQAPLPRTIPTGSGQLPSGLSSPLDQYLYCSISNLFALACVRSRRPPGGPRTPRETPRRAFEDHPGASGASGARASKTKSTYLLQGLYIGQSTQLDLRA